MTERRITLPYRPRAHQERLHSALGERGENGRKYRWSVLVWHRRAGKTWAAVAEGVKSALDKPGGRYAYVAPSFAQAKDIAWDQLKFLTRPIPGMNFSETELRADFPNDSRIRLYGAENPDRMRGLALDGVIIDEPAQQPGSMFSQVLRPALSDRKGWGLWIGTPNGKDDFYRIYTSAQEIGGEWYTSLLRADESGVLDQEELDAALRDMIAQSGEEAGRAQYRQEYLCDFEAPVVGSILGDLIDRAYAEKRIGKVPHEPGVPTEVVFDLGSANTFVLMGQRVGKERRIIDCIDAGGMGYGEMYNQIRERPYTYRKFYLPHDGGTAQAGDPMNRTLAEIYESYGMRPVEVLERGDVELGIRGSRQLLEVAYVDEERCTPAIEAWKAYRRERKEKERTWTRPKHDWASHASDCLRYLAQAWGLYAVPQTESPLGLVAAQTWRSRVASDPFGANDAWMM